MKTKKWLAALILPAFILGGCTNNKTEGAADAGAKSIRVAYAQGGKPITYIDADGNAAGYDIEVFKLIDEALPDYSFEYVPTTDEDLLIGVESGKYDVGLKNAFYTDERAQKFIFPQENSGASATGILIRKEDEATVKDLSDFATLGKKLIPMSPQDANYTVVANYNEQNPDNTINLENSESFTVLDGIVWIAEGRYDGWVTIKSTYEKNVVESEGAYHNLNDQLGWTTFTSTKTWPLFNKNNQDLADQYDQAIKQLKDDGTISELLIEYVGEDTIAYFNE